MDYSEKAYETLVDILLNSKDDAARAHAANALLHEERGRKVEKRAAEALKEQEEMMGLYRNAQGRIAS